SPATSTPTRAETESPRPELRAQPALHNFRRLARSPTSETRAADTAFAGPPAASTSRLVVKRSDCPNSLSTRLAMSSSVGALNADSTSQSTRPPPAAAATQVRSGPDVRSPCTAPEYHPRTQATATPTDATKSAPNMASTKVLRHQCLRAPSSAN